MYSASLNEPQDAAIGGMKVRVSSGFMAREYFQFVQ